MYDGSWLAAGGLRYYECLDVEASHEILASPSVLIGLDVALIPSQPKINSARSVLALILRPVMCSIYPPIRAEWFNNQSWLDNRQGIPYYLLHRYQ